MKQSKFPIGWNEERVHRVLAHYEKQTEDQYNLLMLARVPDNNTASYWAGFYWDKSGQFADYEAWKEYIDQFAQGLLSPIEVSV